MQYVVKGGRDMYLTLKQHDLFRTLLMGFEIPYRAYIAHQIIANFPDVNAFETELQTKMQMLSPSDPVFLRQTLPNACSHSQVEKMYQAFVTANLNRNNSIISLDQDVPMVGGLNIVTFSFIGVFSSLYSIVGSYVDFCLLAEKYRYARNKLDHPGCKTLEESDLVPVLSFVKDICVFLDDMYFSQKSKNDILQEIEVLKNRKSNIPVEINNFFDMPFGESRMVCRENEVSILKQFVYGNQNDLRKKHSCCIFGYGGVGKTALALEVLKEIVQDIQDNNTAFEYAPKYILFFSAKKQRLDISSTSGRIFEKSMYQHFSNASELRQLILTSLKISELRGFHDEGLIIVDNLESLLEEEREEIKQFIEVQTPMEMQFIITSRNSEEYEQNIKLGGFEKESGILFIQRYIQENGLDIELNPSEIEELLTLSTGNTLVLVLCLRRLSQRLSDISGLASDFSSNFAWSNIRKNLQRFPGNAYEVVSEFMFKDTFEELEKVFAKDIQLFYKVLKIFAIYHKDGIDLNTICILAKEGYPKVEAVSDILCNYLILEKNHEQYRLNKFAEKYIINRFMPDATTYEELSSIVQQRERQVRSALNKLDTDIKSRPELANIMRDWYIVSDSDKIEAATMYHLYGEANRECSTDSFLKAEAILEKVIEESKEAENVTVHPYIKYQKARILQLIDRSKILSEVHTEEIMDAFQTAIFVIKTVEQFSMIQQTKSYASLLWLYGQYLSDNNRLEGAIRYLEESKETFEKLRIKDQEFYQCVSKLGMVYLNHYLADRPNNLKYLRMARQISMELQNSYNKLGKTRVFANQLKQELQKYGKY